MQASVITSLKTALRRLLFPGSSAYWEARYAAGGISGTGSRGELAAYKAAIINGFISEHRVQSVIEFGCGDGYQVALGSYPRYIGLDVSRTAIRRCIRRFENDRSRSFFLYDPDCFRDRHELFRAELALSLDVVYHLVEEHTFDEYLRTLFSAATRWVIIYSTDFDEIPTEPHIRHRQFTSWVASNAPAFAFRRTIPCRPDLGQSRAEFYMYERAFISDGS